jgi:hypothetical protein
LGIPLDVDQLLGVLKGKGFEEHGVEKAEDRGVRADTHHQGK